MQGSVLFAGAAGLLAAAQNAAAHQGHLLTGSHWHATDAWGLLVVVAGSGMALWLGGRGR